MPEELYEITAVDDTGIRRVIYSACSWGVAHYQLSEMLCQKPRRYKNPRIRRSKLIVKISWMNFFPQEL